MSSTPYGRFHTRFLNMMIAAVLSTLLVAATVLSTVAAPSLQDNDTVTVSEILLNVNTYEGQSITISGDANIVSDNDNFLILDEQDELRLDRIVVLAPRTMFEDINDEESVTVSGTVRTFTGDVGAEAGLPLNENIADSLQGRAVIIADSIEADMSMATGTTAGDDVVLQIGDTAITSSEFDQRFMKVVGMIAAGQGIPLTDETWQLFEGLRAEYLEQLANEEALSAEAERRSITVTDDELQEQIDAIRQRFESTESFQAALEESGFANEQEFQDFIRRSELLRRVGESLQSEIDITDEDVRAFYRDNPELFYTTNGPVPLEDVQEGIRTQLERQQFNALLLDLREDLKLRIFAENLNPMNQDSMNEDSSD